MNFEPNRSGYSQGSSHELSQGRAAGLAAFFRYVYSWMALGLGVTGLVATWVMYEPTLRIAVSRNVGLLALATFGVGMFVSYAMAGLKPATAAGLFLLYATLMGAMLGPMFAMYTGASIGSAFFIAGGTFAGTALYGYTTQRNLSGVGHFAMVGLIGFMVASIANIWFHSEGISFIVNYGLVLVFALLTAYDNQRLTQMYASGGTAGNLAIMGALTMYLNFINLFVRILQIVGVQNNRRD